MRILTSGLCISLLSCVDAGNKEIVSYFNTPPNIRIDEPVDDASYVQFEDVLFVIYVEDNQDPAEALTLEWSSDIQGTLMGPTNPSEDGTALYPTANLDGGYHTILITVTDTEGLSSAQSIHVDIEGQSGMELISPEVDGYGRTDEETEFSVVVRDGIDPIEDLDIDFSSTHSSVLGSFCTPSIDTEAQTASCSALLDEGIHNITFSAINSLEEETTLEVTFPVYRPEQIDDDGDGFCEEPPCVNVENEPLDTGLDSGSPDTGSTDPMYLIDCNDDDANVAPNKLDILNGIDDNCNGLIDEGDDDGDGYCEVQPCLTSITEVAPDANDEGMIDCDDSKDYTYPNATELPNQEDDDCDGTVDENTDLYDDDGDGYTENQGDCNDDPLLGGTIFPGAPEALNQIDDDCDGIVDDETHLFDDDGDGYCETPPCIGSNAVTGLEPDADTIADCDDNRVETHPNAEEVPNEIDENCNGIIDEQTIVYDDDGDGYCESPPCSGSVDVLQSDADTKNDCNDAEISIYLGAPESANGVDENCDGMIDEGTVVYDDDGDGYCEEPPCIASITTLADDSDSIIDCLDSNDTVYTGALETVNSIDDDCDTVIDNDTVVYDDDGDGYCESPPCVGSSSSIANNAEDFSDCNDGISDIAPGTEEIWYDGTDQNCDGANDFDQDGDGEEVESYTDLNGILQVHGGVDCDDNNLNINTQETEIWYDGTDQNCDGANDFDRDSDGFMAVEYQDTNGVTHQVPGGLDCNDDPSNQGTLYNPNASDDWYDGIDHNCDGANDYDQDGDGYSSETHLSEGQDCNDNPVQDGSSWHPNATDNWYDGLDHNCDGVNDYDQDGDGFILNEYASYTTLPTGDCDDNSTTGAQFYPGATDTWYDGYDHNCDGANDFDQDGDGYIPSAYENEQIEIYASAERLPINDCMDGNEDVNPSIQEICDNNQDDNCNGSQNDENAVNSSEYYIDFDGDGYGKSNDYKMLCFADTTNKYTVTDTSKINDCEDGNSNVFPGQTSYFSSSYTTSSGNQSYDYNCAYGEEKELTSKNDGCSIQSCGWFCTDCVPKGYGWENKNVPDCGDSKRYLEDEDHCSYDGFIGCEITAPSRTQSCR